MFAAVSLLALVGCVAATPAYLVAGAYDDGQWHPELDGSIIGSGAFRWGLDDGSWKPELDGSVLGSGDLTWLSRKRRSLPLDEPVTALAKQAQLIQQNTEATRNILGGGIPLALPADTPEVAAGKQAHAIAHENQKLATSGLYAPLAGAYAAPYSAYAAPYAAPLAARFAPIATSIYPYGVAATPYVANPYGFRAFY
ncbi:hypothetical protein GE061_014743 [Apolygus lucorum]|uniref:Cuticle protein n=1 Tax=Apolygus lucorum TaxID=248454 RepID=A0A8S9XIX3_APOLU|nr:hypothetical protein GE061_014743 [Apolygus lucorum]